MTDGATVVFFTSRFSTFLMDFHKIVLQIRPCPDNYKHKKIRINQISRVVSELFKVYKYKSGFTFIKFRYNKRATSLFKSSFLLYNFHECIL